MLLDEQPAARPALAAPRRLANEARVRRLDAAGNEVAIETLELAHEGFDTE